MDVINMVIAGLLCFQNAGRARRNGMNPLLWGVITFVAFIIGAVAGMLIETMMFYKGEIADRKALVSFLESDFLAQMLILCAGVGGYLGIRAIIDSQRPHQGNDAPGNVPPID